MKIQTGDMEKARPFTELKITPPTPRITINYTKANNAVAYLRARGIHFPWLSKGTTYTKKSDPKDPEYHYELNTSIRFPRRYVVPLRSKLAIDGTDRLVEDTQRGNQIVQFLRTYAVMSAGYGGLHLAAWNFHFPTIVELWMWRGAGILMVSTPIVTIAAWLAWTADTAITKFLKAGNKNLSYKIFMKVLQFGAIAFLFGGVFVVLFGWSAYPFARAYVLAEAFASIRACDRDVYRTVEWTNFIPHAG